MSGGFFTAVFTDVPKQTVKKFREEAERCTSSRSRGDGQGVLGEIETAYWKGGPGNIYGADNEGSLFSDTVRVRHKDGGEHGLPCCALLWEKAQLVCTALLTWHV